MYIIPNKLATPLDRLLFIRSSGNMCIYIAGSHDLGKTKIIVSPIVLENGKLAQFTLYQNEYESSPSSSTPLNRVMILPVPHYTGKNKKYSPFYNHQKLSEEEEPVMVMMNTSQDVFGTTDYTEVFDEIYSSITQRIVSSSEEEDSVWIALQNRLKGMDELPRGLAVNDDNRSSSARPDKIEVFTTINGDYDCSIATTTDDLSPERLQMEALGLDNEEMKACMKFLREKYGNSSALKKKEEEEEADDGDEDDVTAMDIGTLYGGKVNWAFLICRLRDGVTNPQPIMYSHALYSIDDMGFNQDDENYLQQAMFIPTIHYHKNNNNRRTTRDELAGFHHSIIALYPNVFSGAGVGISNSLKQRQLQRCTTRLRGETSSLFLTGQQQPSQIFETTPYHMVSTANKLIQSFPHLIWPFQHPETSCVTYLNNRSVLLYDIDQELPNKDIYLPVQSDLLAFFG